MPDCIGDVKLLKKPLDKNRELIKKADEKYIGVFTNKVPDDFGKIGIVHGISKNYLVARPYSVYCVFVFDRIRRCIFIKQPQQIFRAMFCVPCATKITARLFKKYGAKILGGLHIKMPDCIGDVKLLLP